MSRTLSQLTICCPVDRDTRWPGLIEAEVNRQLDLFGNPIGGSPRPGTGANDPASQALKTALDKAGCVHFMSISFIPGHDAGERAYLVIEASVDGGSSYALEKLFRADFPAVLLPVFETACNAKSADQVAELLRKYRVKYLTNHLPNYNINRQRATGLFFAGAPGQTIAEIHTSRDIHDICRAGIDVLVADDRRGQFTSPSRKVALLTSLFTSDSDTPEGAKLLVSLKEKADIASLLEGERFSKACKFVTEDIERRAKQSPKDAKLPFTDSSIGKKASDAREVSFGKQVRRIAGLFWRPLLAIFLAVLLITMLTFWIDGISFSFDGFISSSVSIGTALAVISVLTVIALSTMAAIVYLTLRSAEKKNASSAFEGAPDIESVRQMMLRENRTHTQNHMISVTRIQRPGWFGGRLRKFLFLPLAFRAVREAADNKWFRNGFLADIGTIHFARWVVLRGTRNMVFFSNYNSNWESYLEDFITKAPEGLTGIWGNTDGFPETENLFDKGARNGDAFKRFARASMIPTRAWYARYPDISVNQIRRNAIIVSGLGSKMNRSHAEAWLSLFDSDQRPADMLEYEDIQTIVFSGVPKLRQSACQIVKFPKDAPQQRIRDWIAEMGAHLTTGKHAPAGRACFMAFSHEGLGRLGLRTSMATHTSPNRPAPNKPVDSVNGDFAAAFKLGMDHATRSNVLFDKGDNAPDKWLWGGRSSPAGAADAVVLIYWNGPEGDDGDYPGELRKTIEKHGLEAGPIIHMAKMKDGPFKEPFGWVDGISQPRMRGVDPQPLKDPLNTVEPGEFVLGYRDDRGYFPATALVPAEDDPNNLLPLPPHRQPGNYPDFSEQCPMRDFGRNGSYLVIRQLEQFKDKFENWCQREADKLNDKLRELPEGERDKLVAGGHTIDKNYIGAKVFGRWPDGTPLVRHPRHPNPQPATDRPCKSNWMHGHAEHDEVVSSFRKHQLNSFRYADEDPQGHNCPFGAHIRRANPRDSLNPDNPNSISIANRHRLLRRGRSFEGPDTDDGEMRTGTFFMCLNADIERQFEFIQQNWLNSAAFHDLNDEVDVIAGQTFKPDDHRSFSIQAAGGASTITGWDSFIRMLGGGYFFLPGRRAMQYLADQYRQSEASLGVVSGTAD